VIPAPLSAAEKRALLLLARAAIQDELLHDRSLERTLAEVTVTPALAAARCCFVTLRTRGPGDPAERLRGCIGTLTSQEPLYRNVIENATQAAFKDPRFPPIEASLLPEVRISVSALTPTQPVGSPAQIFVGRDGVTLEKGPFRSVFLPEVAVEQGWGVEKLVEHLALKAGLRRDGWKDADLAVFQSESFGED
jgi:AmmeMemoRadiSam system protein A